MSDLGPLIQQQIGEPIKQLSIDVRELRKEVQDVLKATRDLGDRVIALEVSRESEHNRWEQLYERDLPAIHVRITEEEECRNDLEGRTVSLEEERTRIRTVITVFGVLWAMFTFVAPYVFKQQETSPQYYYLPNPQAVPHQTQPQSESRHYVQPDRTHIEEQPASGILPNDSVTLTR